MGDFQIVFGIQHEANLAVTLNEKFCSSSFQYHTFSVSKLNVWYYVISFLFNIARKILHKKLLFIVKDNQRPPKYVFWCQYSGKRRQTLQEVWCNGQSCCMWFLHFCKTFLLTLSSSLLFFRLVFSLVPTWKKVAMMSLCNFLVMSLPLPSGAGYWDEGNSVKHFSILTILF